MYIASSISYSDLHYAGWKHSIIQNGEMIGPQIFKSIYAIENNTFFFYKKQFYWWEPKKTKGVIENFSNWLIKSSCYLSENRGMLYTKT